MLDKLGAFFQLVQKNRMGSIIGFGIIVIFAQGYLQYKDKEILIEEGRQAKIRELRCQDEKDSIQRAFQGYLIQQINEVRMARTVLDTSSNYIDGRKLN